MTAPRERSCTGKDRFATRADAHRRIANQMRTRGVKGGQIRAYRCDYCGSWHVGHEPRRRKA